MAGLKKNLTKKKALIKKSPQRYRLYRLVHLSVLLYIGLAGWQRLSLAWTSRSLLEQLGMLPGPAYLIAGGLAWVLFGLSAAGLLLVSRRWAYRAVFGLSVTIAVTYWLDRLFLTRSDIAEVNWPFALLATLLLLAFSASLMIVLSRQDQTHAN